MLVRSLLLSRRVTDVVCATALALAGLSLISAPRGVAVLALVAAIAALVVRVAPVGSFAASSAAVAIGQWGLGAPSRLAGVAVAGLLLLVWSWREERRGWLAPARWAVVGAAVAAVVVYPLARAATIGTSYGPLRGEAWRPWAVPVWAIFVLALDPFCAAKQSAPRILGLCALVIGAAVRLLGMHG